ncbi:hypothetical protein [Mariniflexile sp. AS56]|uniref:hypothetical protein n=1 Tax=Mariniflexile sp. AS56 TaxID=3063957 RepID=UPI0026F20394|nr:hypothetical protein [Mariniflexile sp. AS56]MDO7172274.1 hypothetical protein [Mariniflexile sp. AS56]
MIVRSEESIPSTPSKEESFVKFYLEENGISFKPQIRLFNLKYDDKYAYRDVDFFLPKLGVYVEYYGWYNKSKISRNEYDLKTQVYIKNSLPTIVIYPHELGFIDYAFHTKMLTILRYPKFYKLKNSMIYKMNRYFNKGKGYYLFLSLVLLVISISALYESKREYDFFFIIYILSFGISFGLILQSFRNVYFIFFKDM